MKNEKIFVNVLDFIPNTIIRKREIELPIFEEDIDKCIDEYTHFIKTVDETVFKQIFNGIELNDGDAIIYKGKIYDIHVVLIPNDNRRFIMLEVREQKLCENNENV